MAVSMNELNKLFYNEENEAITMADFKPSFGYLGRFKGVPRYTRYREGGTWKLIPSSSSSGIELGFFRDIHYDAGSVTFHWNEESTTKRNGWFSALNAPE